jgi:hypothetical protein
MSGISAAASGPDVKELNKRTTIQFFIVYSQAGFSISRASAMRSLIVAV